MRTALCVAALAAISALALLLPAGASAARAPSAQEKRAIWRVVLADCRRQASSCRRGGILVSVVDPRFAYAQVRSGSSYSGALVGRGAPTARSWRIRMLLEGGVQSCAEWRRHAPMAVLKDMGIAGFERGKGSASSCWEARCPGPSGSVPGTQAIHSLESRLVGCEAARRLVKRYHAIGQESGQTDLRAAPFDCRGQIASNYEGLVVECRGGKGVTVNWIAQLSS